MTYEGSVAPYPNGSAVASSCTITSQVATDSLIQSFSPGGDLDWKVNANLNHTTWGCPYSVVDQDNNTYVQDYSKSRKPQIQSVDPDGVVRWSVDVDSVPSGVPVIGNGAVYFIEFDGSTTTLEGFDLANGRQTMTYTDSYLQSAYAYGGGEVVVDIFHDVKYLDPSGGLVKEVDPGAIPGAYRTFDSALVDNKGSVVLGMDESDCSGSGQAAIVAKVTPDGVSWFWTSPKQFSTCSGDYIASTPDGGAMLSLSDQSAQGSVDSYSLNASGTLRWQRVAKNPPLSGPVTGATDKPIVDDAGTVGIPSAYSLNCPGRPGNACDAVRIDFVSSVTGNPVTEPLVIEDSGPSQDSSFWLTDWTETPGHVYLAERLSDGYSDTASVSSFAKPALGTEYQLTLMEQRSTGSGPPPPADPGSYLALGDSYSSGEGNPPFIASGGSCDRSVAAAWPELLSRDSGRPLSAMLACSGAHASALTEAFKGQPAQLTSLEAFGNVSLVTATFGGNDLGFAPVLLDCFLHDCVSDGKLAATQRKLPKVQSALVETYARIRTEAAKAQVLAVGYPNLFNTNSGNAGLHCLWLSQAEDKGLVALAVQLDSAMRAAAEQAGVTYVSQLNTFKGHELCTAHSWVVSLALKLSNSSGRGHPTLSGQQAMARVVQSALD